MQSVTPPSSQSLGLTRIWSIGTLTPTTITVITVVVRADQPLISGTQLVNTALVTDAQALGNTARVTTTINSAHTLTLTKSVTPSSASPGSLVTYTLAYTVAGNEPASGIVITDALPANVTFVSSAPAPTQQTVQGQGWSLGTFSPTLATPITGSIVITAQLGTAPALSGTRYVNTAVMSDSSALTSTSSATVTVASAHALSITKVATPTPAIAGSQITYTIFYSITGDEPSLTPTIRDTLPPSTTFASCTGGCVVNTSVVSWSLGGAVVPTTTGMFTLVLNVASNVLSGTALANTVTFTDAQGVTSIATITMPVFASADSWHHQVRHTRPGHRGTGVDLHAYR